MKEDSWGTAALNAICLPDVILFTVSCALYLSTLTSGFTFDDNFAVVRQFMFVYH